MTTPPALATAFCPSVTTWSRAGGRSSGARVPLTNLEDVGLAQVPHSADAALLTRPPAANMEKFLARLRRPVVALTSLPDMHRWIRPLPVLRDGSIVPKLANSTSRNISGTALGALLRQSPKGQHHQQRCTADAQLPASGAHAVPTCESSTVLATSELVRRLLQDATGASIGVAPPLALYTSPGGLYSPRPHFTVTVKLKDGQQIERVDNERAEDLFFVLVASDVLGGGRMNETPSGEWRAEAHEDDQRSRAFRRRWKQEVDKHYAETFARFSLNDIRRQYSRGYSYSEITSYDAIVYIPTRVRIILVIVTSFSTYRRTLLQQSRFSHML